tara:strand:- start:504 stop:632 length:129 start_codon:yes stop_codon:yes gene_type:complete
VIGDVVVFETIKLAIAAVVDAATVVSVDADVPTFLAAYEVLV